MNDALCNFIRHALCALIAGTAGAFNVCAEPYPTAPVCVIVPFGAGGGSDLAARLLAKELSEAFKHPLGVENRPGAGTLIGAKALLDATPDGHTIMISTSS